MSLNSRFAESVFPEMKRPEPIQNIDVGLKTTVEQKGDVLLITDGDADRVGIGDENGVFINQLGVYALLAYYLLEFRKQRGLSLKTFLLPVCLKNLEKLYDVPVYETGVGFKYVAPKMLETDAMIGGEESGGYAFKGNVPERMVSSPGYICSDFMVKTGKKAVTTLSCSSKKSAGIITIALTRRSPAIGKPVST